MGIPLEIVEIYFCKMCQTSFVVDISQIPKIISRISSTLGRVSYAIS